MAMALTQGLTGTADRSPWREETDAGRMADPTARLAPVLEGARARGVVDAFDMAGQAAILLGGAGEVLHAGACAQALLGAGLRVQNGRLVTGDQTCQGLELQLARALEGEPTPQSQGITFAAAGGGIMRARVLSFAGGKSNPAQLLKAVVLLDLVA
jgi:hypothetical protein